MRATRAQHAPDLYDVWHATEVILEEHGLLTHFTITSSKEEFGIIARARKAELGWRSPVVYQALHRVKNSRADVPPKLFWSLLVDIYAQADRGMLGALPGLVDEQKLKRR